jgi:hypothetical protein
MELKAVKGKYNGRQRDGQGAGFGFLKESVSIIPPPENRIALFWLLIP